MRVAYLADRLPAPPDYGARIRAYHLARAISEIADVVLYARTTAEESSLGRHHPAMSVFRDVRLRVLERHAPQMSLEGIKTWTSATEPLREVVADDHAKAPFDLVIAQQLFAVNIADLTGVPLLIDQHNIEGRAARAVLRARRVSERPADKFASSVEAHERSTWARAAALTCVSAADSAFLKSHVRVPVEVVENGVDLKAFDFVAPSKRTGKEILFVGSMFWPPNIQAALFLVNEVLPLVLSAHPDARVTLCGADPGPEVLALAGPNVEVTGTVASVAPFLARARVFANTLFEGAGSSLKTLEPLASGVPLVSTETGVRGFDTAPGREFVVAHTAQEFADAIGRVFDAPETFDAMAVRAREHVAELDWNRIGSRFAAFAASVAQGAGAA